ncbi:hypothetical protein DPMN_088678 [Dreissena polymorpha]|uniref:Uncharacterized protein n=1 Tax=Dreissena polymorpha TaxID=45954 RepID=A0A9D4QXH2_DREPO|nr:hypothetical protein DPMN_088678 [Dreissena polymorpha]
MISLMSGINSGEVPPSQVAVEHLPSKVHVSMPQVRSCALHPRSPLHLLPSPPYASTVVAAPQQSSTKFLTFSTFCSIVPSRHLNLLASMPKAFSTVFYL